MNGLSPSIVCYKIIRCLLFLLPPETAHRLVLALLPYLYPLKSPVSLGHSASRKRSPPRQSLSLAGLTVRNRIGLAAGLDKNGRYVDHWFAMGFGFIEVGTVTPQSSTESLPCAHT